MVSPTTTKKPGLPAGEYRIVAWDLDTTGRRLIDEICQIAAFTPDNNFSQYVMPYRDLDLYSKRRHLIRTVNVGRYRMLKDINTGKIVKTKSDITALQDFLAWLEKIHGDGPGILLLHYETYKLVPFLLLQALAKYDLLDRFSAMVKGFADCYSLVKQRCDQTLTSFSLRPVTKVLLDKKGDIFKAGQRAQLAYQVVQHLTAGEGAGEGAGDGDSLGTRAMVDALLEHSSTIAEELEALEKLKVLLQRQNTLWPIFSPYMRATITAKKNAAAMRRLLAHNLLDYDTLKALWTENKKEALEAGLKIKLPDATEEQYADIIKTLVEHFDPNSQPTIPERKPIPRGRKSYNKKNIKSKPTPNNEPSSTTSETTTTTTSSSPSKSNGVDTPKIEESPKHQLKAEETSKHQPKAEEISKHQPKAEETSKHQPKKEDTSRPQPKAEVSPKSQPKTEVSPKNQPKSAESPKTQSKAAESPKIQSKAAESPKTQRKADVPRKTPSKATESPKHQSPPSTIPGTPFIPLIPPTPVSTPVNNTLAAVSPEKK